MKSKRLLIWVIVVCVVAFGSLTATLLAGWGPKLGLDLAGGISLTYVPQLPGKAPGAVPSQDINTTINIIRSRINSLGVAQPNVLSQGNTIVVQLPGISDLNKAKSLIGSTAQLTFRPILCQVSPYSPPKVKKGQPPPQPPTGPPPTCNQSYTASTYQQPAGSTTGVNSPPTDTNPAFASYPNQIGKVIPNNENLIAPLSQDPQVRFLLGPAAVTGDKVTSAQPALNNGQWQVDVSFNSTGATQFDNFASANYHKNTAIVLDGEVISDPIIIAQNFNGQVAIQGLTQSQAQNLAIELQYGALPVQLSLQTSQSVSPTLGAASLKAGLLAGVLGLILVMIYTTLYYRGLGLVVILGLATSGAFLFALISSLGHTEGLTLDLSGVTGLIVSVGITVDSYIVYFERLKDEIRTGRSVRTSVDKGFKSAFRTVVVADLVSLIAAAVLYFLSVGAVKGFAFFLGLSTILDLFTAYAFTRPLVILLGRSKFFTEFPIIGVARGLLSEESPKLAVGGGS